MTSFYMPFTFIEVILGIILTMKSSIILLLSTLTLFAEHPLAIADAKLGREAIQIYLGKGAAALPELRELAGSDDPRLRSRAKEAIGGLTGHWGSQVDLIWKRSMKDAIGKDKPIMLLHLFGNRLLP